jgi:hypothetical protein
MFFVCVFEGDVRIRCHLYIFILVLILLPLQGFFAFVSTYDVFLFMIIFVTKSVSINYLLSITI